MSVDDVIVNTGPRLIFRTYAPEASVYEGLKDRETFKGPPGVMPVACK